MNIWISHPDDAVLISDICPTMDLDRGPLAPPESLGSFGRYADMISAYDEWLEEQIKLQNAAVCLVLDNIFCKAQTTGIILTTKTVSETNHAHIVKRHIEDLAASTADG